MKYIFLSRANLIIASIILIVFAIIFQALKIEFFGKNIVWVGFLFFLIVNLYYFRPSLKDLYFFLILGIILSIDFLYSSSQRGLFGLIFISLTYITYRNRVFIDDRYKAIPIKILYLVCILISLVGIYRYLFGFSLPNSENLYGLISCQDRAYPYFGISYINSSRNSDSLFFVAGLISSYWLYNNSKGNERFFYILGVLLFTILCFLTLSRWVFLAVLLAYLILASWRSLGFLFLALLIIFIAVKFYDADPISNIKRSYCAESNTARINSTSQKIHNPLQLFSSSILSIARPKEASNQVSNSFQYSNNQRVNIYLVTIKEIIGNPLGHGYDNPGDDLKKLRPNLKILHSENLFLDFIHAYGIFAIMILFPFVFFKYKTVINLKNNSFNSFGLSLGLAMILFASLNSPINYSVFWILLFLSFTYSD